MGKKIILLLLLTFAVFGQDKYWYYYWNQNGTIYTETPVVLPSLVANSDTVWAGNYFPLAVYNDTVRYDSVTNIYATIWRRNSDRTFNRIGITEDLFPSVVDSGTCNINITPIAARIGDYFGWRIVTASATYEGISLSSASRIGQDGNITKVKFWYDDGIAFNWCHNRVLYGHGDVSVGYFDDSIAYCDSAIVKTTNKDFRAGTTLDTNYHFAIHFYETPAPVIVVTGDSHMSGWKDDRSWTDHATLNTYSPTDGLPYRLSAYWQLTNQNVGIGGDKVGVITDRSFVTYRDVTGKNPELVIYDGGSNDGSSTLLGIGGTRLQVIQAIDSAIANGFPFYYIESPGMQSRDTLMMARIDSLNTCIKNYIDSNYANDCHYIPVQSYICQNRAGSTLFPSNLWDLKPEHNADNTHFTPQAYGLITRVLVDTLNGIYSFPTDTTAIYWTLPSLPDTSTAMFPATITATVKYVLGVDSVKLVWNRNGNGDTTLTLSNSYSGSNGTSFRNTWTLANPTLNDTITYTFNAYANGKTKTSSGSFALTSQGIPRDSLQFAYEFQQSRGIGKNTYGTTMTSLIGSDVLTLVNAPTDSTSFGYISFNGTDEYATLSTKTITAPYTIVAKVQGFDHADFEIVWSWSANYYGGHYTVNGRVGSVGTEGFIDYIVSALSGSDSTSAWTSEGDFYREGILKADNAYNPTLSSSVAMRIMAYHDNTLPFSGRLYCFYFYNRILTPAEIALFN